MGRREICTKVVPLLLYLQPFLVIGQLRNKSLQHHLAFHQSL
jgi:hypothetical protein